jgi:predicted nucleotidyltransferase
MANDKDIVLTKINTFIEFVAQHVTVDKVILYGSWAHGSATELSDIDLAIFSPDFGKHKLKELQLLSKLAWEVDESIEAVPYSIEQLDNLVPTKFVYKIIQTGETVYDRALMH